MAVKKTKAPSKKAPSTKGASKTKSATAAKKSAKALSDSAQKVQVRMTRAARRFAAKKVDPKARKVKTMGSAPHSTRITPMAGPIQPLASQTSFVPKENSVRSWVLVDAAGLTVGRIASEIAMLLRGKHKAEYTPNNDAGDFVVVVNAEKVVFKSNKEKTKEYYNHSGYIGGLKVRTPESLRAKFPERILERAVRGMVPRSPLGRAQMKKLKIYAGPTHPHKAQNPTVWNPRSTVVSGAKA